MVRGCLTINLHPILRPGSLLYTLLWVLAGRVLAHRPVLAPCTPTAWQVLRNSLMLLASKPGCDGTALELCCLLWSRRGTSHSIGMHFCAWSETFAFASMVVYACTVYVLHSATTNLPLNAHTRVGFVHLNRAVVGLHAAASWLAVCLHCASPPAPPQPSPAQPDRSLQTSVGAGVLVHCPCVPCLSATANLPSNTCAQADYTPGMIPLPACAPQQLRPHAARLAGLAVPLLHAGAGPSTNTRCHGKSRCCCFSCMQPVSGVHGASAS